MRALTIAAVVIAPVAGAIAAVTLWYVLMVQLVAPFAAYLNSL